MWLRLYSKIKIYLAVVGAVVLAVLSAYLRGRRDQKALGVSKELNDYVETRQTIDGASDAIDDAGGAREWLLNRQRKQ